MQRIGVLRGGVGGEYHLSLASGARIMEALRKEGYDVLDMLVDRDGILHIKGIPATITDVPHHVDMVWNALHGGTGEDGTVQRLLDSIGIPYTGSSALTSAMMQHKALAKERAKELGIKTPESILVMPEGSESVSEISQNIYKRMAPPWVVKPLYGGASAQTYFAFTPLELAHMVEESVSHGQPFLVEQYIYGKEAAVGVIDGFRGQDQYVLPVVGIKSAARGILTHDDRTNNEYTEVPSTLRPDERETLSTLARKLHSHIGASDYSQSEFIVDKNGKIWYLETDTSPHMGERHPFAQALKSVGSSIEEFVKSIIGKKA